MTVGDQSGSHVPGGSGGTTGRAEQTAGAAKEQAGEVAGHAKEQVGQVAASAQQQAGQVVAEAKGQAIDLLGQVRSQIDEQTTSGRDRLVTLLRQAGRELSQMAGASEGDGVATHLVRQAGERASTWGEHLDGHEPRELLDQLRRFARRRPGTFLLGALAAGVVAGRVTRGATASSSHTPDTPGRHRGTEVEPLATAPAASIDVTGVETPGTGTGGYMATRPTTPVNPIGTGYPASAADTDDVGVIGENVNEDLVPHHIRSDVPSVSDAPTHGGRP